MLKSDLKQLAKFSYEAFWLNKEGTVKNKKYEKEHLIEVFKQKTCWTAVKDNTILGGLFSYVYTFGHGKELYIDLVIVGRKYQKKGIGTLLMQKAINYAQRNKMKGLRLITSPQLESYKWYPSIGFRENGFIEMCKSLD